MCQRDQITVRVRAYDQHLGEGEGGERDYDRERLKTDVEYRKTAFSWALAELGGQFIKLLDDA